GPAGHVARQVPADRPPADGLGGRVEHAPLAVGEVGAELLQGATDELQQARERFLQRLGRIGIERRQQGGGGGLERLERRRLVLEGEIGERRGGDRSGDRGRVHLRRQEVEHQGDQQREGHCRVTLGERAERIVHLRGELLPQLRQRPEQVEWNRDLR